MTNKADGSIRNPVWINLILIPVVFYPFMFLLRSFDSDSVLLSIAPDLLTLFVVCLFGIHCLPSMKRKFILFVLAFHVMLTYILVLYHVADLRFLLIAFRQYSLPVLYIAVFIAAGEKYPGLPLSAVKHSIISFGLVCLVALLNFFEFFRINSSLEALYPYLNYVADSQFQDPGRLIFGSFNFHRINLFVGGAVGSSAAILVCLGLIGFTQSQAIPGFIFRFFGIVLIISSILTLSVSLFIPIFLFLAINYLAGVWRIKISFVFWFLFLIIFFGPNIFLDRNPVEYFRSTIYSESLDYLANIDYSKFLLGVGPRFVSAGYEFVPESLLVDVGIFRVFVESGFINMLLFFVFLISAAYICCAKFALLVRGQLVLLPLIFFTYILAMHANMAILPPFFPLFAAVVSGIFLVGHESRVGVDGLYIS